MTRDFSKLAVRQASKAACFSAAEVPAARAAAYAAESSFKVVSPVKMLPVPSSLIVATAESWRTLLVLRT